MGLDGREDEDASCWPRRRERLEKSQAGGGNILRAGGEGGRRKENGGKSQTRRHLRLLFPTKTESPTDWDLCGRSQERSRALPTPRVQARGYGQEVLSFREDEGMRSQMALGQQLQNLTGIRALIPLGLPMVVSIHSEILWSKPEARQSPRASLGKPRRSEAGHRSS